MEKFYTSYFEKSATIFVRYVDENGDRKSEEIDDYAPRLYEEGEGEFKSLYGKSLLKKEFKDIWDARRHIKRYEEVSGFPLYGWNKFDSSYIYENYPSTKFDYSSIMISSIDIENEVENSSGMSIEEIVELVPDKITLITISKNNDEYHTFTTKDISDRKRFSKFNIHVSSNEEEMLENFVRFLQDIKPDILSGWNIDSYDIPYITNRIKKVLGEDFVKYLSPWEMVFPKRYKGRFGKEVKTYEWKGIEIVDYLDIYKKFELSPRDSYTLDNISNVELGKGKHDNGSNIPGHLLYRYEEYWDDYVYYNIVDTKRVMELEEKKSLIRLTMTVAHIAGVNYSDVVSSMRVWDNLIYRYLAEKGVYSSVYNEESFHKSYVGGYVKPPIVGKYGWIMSFDVTSEYPLIIRGLNISPETIVDDYNEEIGGVDKFLCSSEKYSSSYSVALNGSQYDKSFEGVMPSLVKWLFSDRKMYKNLMFEDRKAGRDHDADINDLFQKAIKVLMNSLYGCMGNKYFRFFDIRNAEAITTTGQAMIRSVTNDINDTLSKIIGEERDRIIAIDTDSGYFDVDEIVKKKFPNGYKSVDEVVDFLDRFSTKIIKPVIDKSLARFGERLNALHPEVFQMDREVICDSGIFVAKKRYFLNVLDNEGISNLDKETRGHKGEIKIMGLEAIKSSSPILARSIMKDIFVTFLFDDELEYQDIIEGARNNFIEEKDFDKIAFNRSVNFIEKYEGKSSGIPINTRAAMTYNRLIIENKKEHAFPLIQEGDKIKYIYLKKINPFSSHVMAWVGGDFPTGFGVEKWIDYEKQFDISVLKPLRIISSSIGWSDERRSSLFDFF